MSSYCITHHQLLENLLSPEFSLYGSKVDFHNRFYDILLNMLCDNAKNVRKQYVFEFDLLSNLFITLGIAHEVVRMKMTNAMNVLDQQANICKFVNDTLNRSFTNLSFMHSVSYNNNILQISFKCFDYRGVEVILF